MSYVTRKIKRASERGRRMALRRWALDRKRRDKLSAAEPAFACRTIVSRIIHIRNEVSAREVVIYSDDSLREARRKVRSILR